MPTVELSPHGETDGRLCQEARSDIKGGLEADDGSRGIAKAGCERQLAGASDRRLAVSG